MPKSRKALLRTTNAGQSYVGTFPKKLIELLKWEGGDTLEYRINRDHEIIVRNVDRTSRDSAPPPRRRRKEDQRTKVPITQAPPPLRPGSKSRVVPPEELPMELRKRLYPHWHPKRTESALSSMDEEEFE